MTTDGKMAETAGTRPALPLGRLAFTASLALVFAVALLMAREFRSNIWILPTLACAIGLAGCALQIVFDVLASRSQAAAKRIFDIGFEEGSDPVAAMTSMYIWMALIVVVAIVFGVLAVAFLFPFAYVLFHLYAREGTRAEKLRALRKALLTALICGGFIYIVFDRLLGMVWPLSLVQEVLRSR